MSVNSCSRLSESGIFSKYALISSSICCLDCSSVIGWWEHPLITRTRKNPINPQSDRFLISICLFPFLDRKTVVVKVPNVTKFTPWLTHDRSLVSTRQRIQIFIDNNHLGSMTGFFSVIGWDIHRSSRFELKTWESYRRFLGVGRSAFHLMLQPVTAEHGHLRPLRAVYGGGAERTKSVSVCGCFSQNCNHGNSYKRVRQNSLVLSNTYNLENRSISLQTTHPTE